LKIKQLLGRALLPSDIVCYLDVERFLEAVFATPPRHLNFRSNVPITRAAASRTKIFYFFVKANKPMSECRSTRQFLGLVVSGTRTKGGQEENRLGFD